MPIFYPPFYPYQQKTFIPPAVLWGQVQGTGIAVTAGGPNQTLAFPQNVDAGLRVTRIGASSVRYEVGLFAEGEAQTAAHGHFVHVYVDSQTRRPVSALPAPLLQVLKDLE
jgi:hypothetical protein